MQEPTPIDSPDEDIEAALRDLKLAPLSGGAEEQLWYSAGFAAGRRRARLWQSAAAGFALLAGASMLWRPAQNPTSHEPVVSMHDMHELNRIVSPALSPIRPRLPAVIDTTPDAPISVAQLRLRDALIEHGADALPATAAGDADSAGQRVWPLSQLAIHAAGPESWNWTSDRGG
ncbi:MAG: hypothetical protein JWL69_4771 [Phycisphaerales bacterium]|jgi:hypothetical protein|nr:hypothetical protein [Phycisphaerales bacterium]MDB5357598.1 hypothetical protein [Phycisphaerales bacterium]